MSTNEWITDRLPMEGNDGWYVYNMRGNIIPCSKIPTGTPWKPIPPCEPYVGTEKRYGVMWLHDTDEYCVIERNGGAYKSYSVPTREAAERIAAIYEEVMP